MGDPGVGDPGVTAPGGSGRRAWPTVARAGAAAARQRAREALEASPAAWCAVMARRHPEWFLVSPGTGLVIEGYQSAGNTFARKATLSANPGLAVASHAHSPAHVARALRLRRPVVVLLRPPIDAVASHAVRMRLTDLDAELARYQRFYERTVPVADRVVLSSFEATTARFGDVIGAVNRRFGTALVPFDHADPAAAAAVFAEMEREAAGAAPDLDRRWRIARPHEGRATATAEVRERLRRPAHQARLAACERVHAALVASAV